MEITFEMEEGTQAITEAEFYEFQTMFGKTFPEDYKQHMLTYNGGEVIESGLAHKSTPEEGGGISYFFPIKYGSYTIEMVYNNLNGRLPNGYISIGRTNGGDHIIISLNDDSTYGVTKEWFSDGTILDLSPSFTQLLNDMVEMEDY